ncbi:MAG: type I methionyl aminopeptidase [Thermoguttaceae bacterium]
MEILRSPREIAQMRKAGLLVWEAFQIARDIVRPGVTTGQIDAAVAQYFAQHGAEPLFLNYPNSVEGGPPFPAVTCISVNREVVHGIPGKRQLVEGDIVSVDTGCRLGGWCGDAAATLPVGRVHPDILRLVEVTRNVLHLAIDRLGRSKWWSEVAEEMQQVVRSAGFSVVEDFVGHGIGRKMHEEPQVPNFVKRGFRRGRNDFRLVPGLVIAVEPMVNLGTKQVRLAADQWTQVTADGRASAHFEHTIALAESGPLVLTAGPNGESW